MSASSRLETMKAMYGAITPSAAAGTPESIMSHMYGPAMSGGVGGMAPEVVGVGSQVPPGYAGNMGAPEDTSQQYVTGRSQRSHVHVAGNYTLRPHANGSHLKYDPATPLFVLNPQDDPGKSTAHTIYSIWDVNWNLRMATAYKQRQRLQEAAAPVYGRKRRTIEDPVLENFPTTVQTVADALKYIGFGYSAVQQDPDQNPIRFRAGKREMGAQWQGTIHNVANIWGPGVNASYHLYFAIKVVPWDGVLTDWKGERLAEAASYDREGLVQVVPVFSETGGTPMGSRSRTTNPRDTDNDSLQKVTVECGSLDPGVNATLQRNRTTMTYHEYVPAHLIKVGTVARANTRRVSSEASNLGTFSFTGYQDLCRNYQQLDIDLSERNAWKACC